MKVKNIGSNQTEVHLNNGDIVLVSYETPVAAFVVGEGYYRTSEKWSATTTKHINKWLDGVKSFEVDQEVLNDFF